MRERLNCATVHRVLQAGWQVLGSGVAQGPEEERGFFVADQLAVEVDALLRVIGCRRRKTRRHGPGTDLQF